ncbi:FAD-dependent monooxygenase [Mycobacterium sp. CVI_P3]|uniref:FAD-dependent monooxygenase n=1 Tax=Mycobacterium pinniadriaticum TaxID=2994102 RepID=A0ABT3SGQ3_9MYCO|nr:FAD-dependent oxidoreductase [Mycobacterium pinniadriaticum]MCX2932237.1 FAD-dependent monooxygenase [Mycobacterium pinniadriaticum]MCX2938663.1 FAD-dependent monooxygenase [Mycobacterium pinniadriaticum]
MGTDVVVVGAGPTGLSLACGLLAAGVAVRVVDKAPGPATTSRALGLQPRGVEVLDRLGALGDLPQRALPVDRVTMIAGGRELANLRVAQNTSLNGPRALIMSQADIEAALRHRLAALGGDVEWGHGVAGLIVGSNAAGVRLDDGSQIDAQWVVGADGAHSAVRKAVDIGFPGVPLVERFLLADVRADVDRPRDGVTTWLGDDAMLAAFPLPGTDLWRLMAPAPPSFADDSGSEDIAGHLCGRFPPGTVGAVRSVEWTSTFRIQRRLADTYRRGRVLLAGDAAHIHSPFGGQGMNTGIGDAENLAWKLALVIRGRAETRLVDTYGAERRPVAEDVLETTSGLTRIVMGDGPVRRWLRDRVAVPLLNREWMQRLITDKASQLQISYRRGPLGSPTRPGLSGPQPGDRIPDRSLTGAGGVTVRLFDALGPGWAVIGDSRLAAVAAERLGDLVAGFDGTDSHTLLVRPDAHLAWRGSDPEKLRAWLSSQLGSPAGILAR